MAKDEVYGLDESIHDVVLDIGGEEIRMGEFFAIDDTNIAEEFGNQAARYAYLGIHTAYAEAEYEEAKADADLIRARLDAQIRAEPISAGERKPTESAIANMIESDEQYRSAMEQCRELHENYKVMRAVEVAMRQRGDMLVSLGATLRQEFEVTDMAMRRVKEELSK